MVKQDSSCGRSGSHGKNDKKKLRSINQTRILMTWNATIMTHEMGYYQYQCINVRS
jgi:hypothetical protein